MDTTINIKALNITKKFKTDGADLCILNDLNFEFHQGISYAIQGISGAGKTTLINILAGLDAPSSGTILYNEYNINEKINQAKHSQVIGLIFQDAYLLQELSVLENVMIKGFINKLPLDEKVALDLLDLVQLKNKASAYPHQLSGGEQQRVSIVRALFNKPNFLMADEPTAHLDKANKNRVIELLLYFKQHYNVGLILSTHDPLVAKAMDVQLEIYDGKLVTVA